MFQGRDSSLSAQASVHYKSADLRPLARGEGTETDRKHLFDHFRVCEEDCQERFDHMVSLFASARHHF